MRFSRHATVVIPCRFLMVASALLAASPAQAQTEQQDGPSLPADYSCIMCHTKGGDLWAEGMPIVEAKEVAADVHWQKGLRCHDCHGGSPTLDEFKNHRDDPSFNSVTPRDKIPGFCGHCHSKIDYMRRFAPSARTDQEAEYWTSGHGRRLRASMEGENPEVDQGVATCIDCHGGRHKIMAVKDSRSTVYPANVAQTCSHCHSDAKLMAGRIYNGHPLAHDQHELWRQGVHGKAMTEKGDLSAPTCNDCHGNHGAMPPGVDSVANACGGCHGKVAKLFAETQMRHKFEQAGLPGCATCHGAHKTVSPGDEQLGMGAGTLCDDCHNAQNPKYGATVAGADVARSMRDKLEQLKSEIDEAEAKVKDAERLGMEVRGPRFDLRQAFDSLTNARTLVHTFKPAPLEEALNEGLSVTANVKNLAEASLREHTYRRIWLAASLIPIFIVVSILLFYIRSLPAEAHEG